MADSPHAQCRQVLTFFAEHAGKNTPPSENWRYTSMYDLMLREGRDWGPPLRGDADPFELAGTGPNRECFRNAFEAVSAWPDDLVYVEGYAVSVIPTLHAWTVVASTGEVVDPTWDDGGDGYVGVAFDLDFVFGWLATTERWGVFGGEHRNLLDLLRNGLPDGAVVAEV